MGIKGIMEIIGIMGIIGIMRIIGIMGYRRTTIKGLQSYAFKGSGSDNTGRPGFY